MDIYTLNQKPVEFSTTIKITDNKYNEVDLDLTNNTNLEMEFQKPNGAILSVDAEPSDSATLTNGTVKFLNNQSTGSILDSAGQWQYRGVVYKNGTEIRGSWIVFWVTN